MAILVQKHNYTHFKLQVTLGVILSGGEAGVEGSPFLQVRRSFDCAPCGRSAQDDTVIICCGRFAQDDTVIIFHRRFAQNDTPKLSHNAAADYCFKAS
jgi:hypothetical protein